jgi:hypothetical protein
MFFTNPFVKRSALNSQLTRRFGNGVVCHLKNTHPVYFVNLKTQTRKGLPYISPGSTEEYRIFGMNRKYWWARQMFRGQGSGIPPIPLS